MPQTLLLAAPYLAAASAVVGVASTVQSHNDAKAGQKKAAQAADLKARADAITQARERASQIRQARVAAATVNSNTTAAGATGSSAQSGALGSLQTQAAGNVNYLDTQGALIGQANSNLTTANKYYGDASVFGDIGKLSFGITGAAFNYAYGPKAGATDQTSSNPADNFGYDPTFQQ